jgi:hypothetical protein
MDNYYQFMKLFNQSTKNAEEFLCSKYGMSKFQAWGFVMGIKDVDEEWLPWVFGAMDAHIGEAPFLSQLT